MRRRSPLLALVLVLVPGCACAVPKDVVAGLEGSEEVADVLADELAPLLSDDVSEGVRRLRALDPAARRELRDLIEANAVLARSNASWATRNAPRP